MPRGGEAASAADGCRDGLPRMLTAQPSAILRSGLCRDAAMPAVTRQIGICRGLVWEDPSRLPSALPYSSSLTHSLTHRFSPLLAYAHPFIHSATYLSLCLVIHSLAHLLVCRIIQQGLVSISYVSAQVPREAVICTYCLPARRLKVQ